MYLFISVYVRVSQYVVLFGSLVFCGYNNIYNKCTFNCSESARVFNNIFELLSYFISLPLTSPTFIWKLCVTLYTVQGETQ